MSWWLAQGLGLDAHSDPITYFCTRLLGLSAGLMVMSLFFVFIAGLLRTGPRGDDSALRLGFAYFLIGAVGATDYQNLHLLLRTGSIT